MKTTILSLLLFASITYSQITMEIYVPDVGGTHFDNQSVKVWDANSGEYYGERFTTNSLVVFDNITSVETDPINYTPSAGYDPISGTIYYETTKEGKVEVLLTDILGQTKRKTSNTNGGREEIKLGELLLSNYSNGFYAVRIITPQESYSLGLIKNGINYSATKVVKWLHTASLRKTTLADEIRVEVTHEDHYKRTFTAEKGERVEDYVVGYVDQMKTDSTKVTPEEFKQYCWDFNMNDGAGGMGWGLKSFFPNENKEIWIAMSDKNNPSITFNYEQMESIRDLVIQEIYPYIAPENQPSFYLQESVNPDEIPLYETGKILIMPKSAGYSFGVNGNPQTGVIEFGLARMYKGLDLGDITQPPANDQERIARAGVLEEVASCFMGPRGNQGGMINTIMINGGKMYPVDIKLMEMTQKYQPMTPIDDVLGIN